MILERKKGILIVDWHYGRHLSRVFYHNVSFSNKWILFDTIFYFLSDNQVDTQSYSANSHSLAEPRPERIYNPITTMGFSAMFTFQLDNTKR